MKSITIGDKIQKGMKSVKMSEQEANRYEISNNRRQNTKGHEISKNV